MVFYYHSAPKIQHLLEQCDTQPDELSRLRGGQNLKRRWLVSLEQ